MKRSLFLCALLLASCHRDSLKTDTTKSASKPQVLVANYPLQFFAQRIGGASVDVVFPAPADEDPAFWQPSDAQIAQFQNASVILMNGATYSKWAEKSPCPNPRSWTHPQAFRPNTSRSKQTAHTVAAQGASTVIAAPHSQRGSISIKRSNKQMP
ncbi:MAG: zinc ABC transporter substrate-binding protein [Verrucomicrobiaceae bacterium]|nr:zinc ABC transporter substrate-binding protein [Verrucomicrobiaceae bacterium]